MGEIGCLKDGNFQNLETQQLMLGGSSIHNTIESSGLLLIDTTVAVGDTPLVANRIHYIADTPTGARTLTFPALSTLSNGDKFLIVMANDADATHFITITAPSACIIGTVLFVPTGLNADATKLQLPMVATQADAKSTTIKLSLTAAGAGTIGTKLLFTVVGAGSAAGTHLFLSGNAVTADVDANDGTEFFKS